MVVVNDLQRPRPVRMNDTAKARFTGTIPKGKQRRCPR